jgi:hypothetical protein
VNHPLDEPELADKVRLARTVRLAILALLVVISVGFSGVVFLTLDGVPLAGNQYTIGGLSVLTVAALVVTPFVPVVAAVAGRRKRAELVERTARTHPEVAGPEADAEGLVTAYVAGAFQESAVAVGFAFGLALLFHVISSPWLLGCIAVLWLVLAARLPSLPRARRWYDAEIIALRGRREGQTRPR